MKQQTRLPKSSAPPATVAKPTPVKKLADVSLPGNSRAKVVFMQFVYLGISGLALLILTQLPQNKAWLNGPIRKFYSQKHDLSAQTDVEFRKQAGWGSAFAYTNFIRQQCRPTDYFLIPPQRYLIRNAYSAGAIDGYAWVYPSLLYYHLGGQVHLLDMTAADSLLRRATHTFWAQNGQLTFLPLNNQNRPQVVTEFRKYDPHFFAYTPQQAQAYYTATPPNTP